MKPGRETSRHPRGLSPRVVGVADFYAPLELSCKSWCAPGEPPCRHGGVDSDFASRGLLSAPLRASLCELELTDPVGFRGLFDGGEAEADRMVRELGGEPGDVAVVVSLWSQAAVAASQLERRLSKKPSPSEVADAIIFEREGEKRRRKMLIDSVHQALSLSLKPNVPAASTGPPGKWPTRLRRSLALAGDASAREKAERAERDRWI